MKLFTYIIAIMIMLASCSGNKVKRDDEQDNYSIYNKNLIIANKYIVKENAYHIDSYIKRRNWQMQDGEGGIRYMIVEHGTGDSVVHLPNIKMQYRVELLDGTLCYDSQTDGIKEITVGASEIEPGMTRTLRRLCHGDSAILILPPHYAKGLIGDMNKIPPISVIVYYIRIEN